MYEAEFGTDWESVTTDEAITRAYALGIAASLGNGRPDEYDRVCRAVGNRHDRSLVELAYQRGLGKARKHRRQSSMTDDDVWTRLVDEVDEVPTDGRSIRDYPDALLRLPALDPPGDGLDRIRLPRFLFRGDR